MNDLFNLKNDLKMDHFYIMKKIFHTFSGLIQLKLPNNYIIIIKKLQCRTLIVITIIIILQN